jgi:hypothetical protein
LQDAARLQSQQQWATDPLFENTTLLLQADNAANAAQNNTFLDSSSNAFTITRNGNTTQGTFTPFSATGWSNFFGATTSDGLTFPSIALGTNSFTFECWFYPTETSYPTFTYLMAVAVSGGDYVNVGFNGVTNQVIFGGGGGGLGITAIVGTYTPNTWNHIAAVRNGTTCTLYINGISQGTPQTTPFSVTTAPAIVGGLSWTSGYAFKGYISNARIVVGRAVYTSNFTPSTAPLGTTSGGQNPPTGTQTVLLTCQDNRFKDNSSSNSVATITGTPSVQAFAPFAPQFQYTPTVIGGSGYFNGTTNSLTLPAGAIPSGAGTAFTIEFWIYQSVLGGTVLRANGNGSSLSIGMNTNGTVSIDNVFVASILTTTGAATAGGWNHIAITRTTGNLYTVYINGVSAGSTTYAGSLGSQQSFIAYNTFTGAYTTAYISDFRCVNSLVYTAAFTPPTAPLTAITNTQFLCNFTNAAITDGTMKNNLETVGNAQVSTSIVKYGAGSMAFDGSGDSLKIGPTPLLNLGTGDFTIEFWCNPNTVGASKAILASGNATFNAGAVIIAGGVSGNDSMRLGAFDFGGPSYTIVRDTSATPTGTWTHYAFVRLNNSFVLYRNGTSVATGTWTGSFNFNTNNLTKVGGDTWDGASSSWDGYIDDLRITRFARYTANFTPPQVALPRQ